jgi:hypothetical protein
VTPRSAHIITRRCEAPRRLVGEVEESMALAIDGDIFQDGFVKFTF